MAKPKNAGPQVYCGPTIRGVARQYTPYNSELPAALAALCAEHPALKGLIVPMERFAETRAQLEKPGTAQSILYDTARRELGL